MLHPECIKQLCIFTGVLPMRAPRQICSGSCVGRKIMEEEAHCGFRVSGGLRQLDEGVLMAGNPKALQQPGSAMPHATCIACKIGM